MQLMDDDLWDRDKLQTCAKGKSILEFRSVSMGSERWKKLQQRKKVPENGLFEPPFREYV